MPDPKDTSKDKGGVTAADANPAPAAPGTPAPAAPAAELVAALRAAFPGSSLTPPSATPDLDRTVPGGHFIVDGRHVDAWGKDYQEGKDAAAVTAEAANRER